jgi:hypothetical protein
MKRLGLLIIISAVVFAGGCGVLRKAPGEIQKQNAWVHFRTANLAADAADREDASEHLQKLTRLGEFQSRAFVSYFGLPESPKQVQTVEQAVSEQNFQLAQEAGRQGAQRIEGWDVVDGAVELGIGICAIAGGVWGSRAAKFLKSARQKTDALREIIQGNELFKADNPRSAAAFKRAQANQSKSTRKIVTEMKNG